LSCLNNSSSVFPLISVSSSSSDVLFSACSSLLDVMYFYVSLKYIYITLCQSLLSQIGCSGSNNL
jgi:hypothetical protein